MARPLKFRVWRFCHALGGAKFYYLNYLQITDHDGADICFSENHGRYFDSTVEDLDLMTLVQQFTGLKDANDKDIYEGDIVHLHSLASNDYYCRTVFLDGGFAFKVIKPKGTLAIIFANTAKQGFFDMKVIGNEQENPELLIDAPASSIEN